MDTDTHTFVNIMIMLTIGVVLPTMWAMTTMATQYYATRMPEAMPSHRSTVKVLAFFSVLSVVVLAAATVVVPWPWALAAGAILVPVMAVSIAYTLRTSRRFHAAAVPAP